jgi:patatin-like phospholipase/acyl hydrolase
MSNTSNHREFRILSLAGGGYLGLYTACVLADLEARAGEPLGRCFDLIAGTSVGGILALGLGFELPMDALVKFFATKGSEVFSRRPLPSGRMSRLIDLTRSVRGPKYTGTALRDALAEFLGERTMRESRHRVVIPAVNVSRCTTKIFKTPHAAHSMGDGTVRAVDVAMATCAAPAYFPAVRIGDTLFADGGLFAVAPDQVALHEVEHFMAVDPSVVRMLSIGTATKGYRPTARIDNNAGAVGWLSDGRLILTLVSVQQQHVEAMMQDRLGDRYVRLDAPWPTEAGLGIDVATRKAVDTLTRLARQTIQKANPEMLARFVEPRESERPDSAKRSLTHDPR